MNRIKSLDPPHKGLRNALCQLTLLAGKTDYANPESIAKLQALGKEVFHLLKDHTRTENKFILAPLEAKVKGSTSEFAEDHHEIDELETELYDELMAFNGKQSEEEGHQFYLDLCDFQSFYLMHIDGEDTEIEPLMQEHFSDEELMGHQIEIMKEIAEGMSTAEIARSRGVSEQAIDKSINRISKHLGIPKSADSNLRVQIVRAYFQNKGQGI
jgi:hypothetical protein